MLEFARKKSKKRQMSGSIACLSRTVNAHVVATSSVQHITAGGDETDGSDMKDRLKHRKRGK
eukprot:scaffold3656_cov125-Cylindrotheca_fusiformis.AAC.1